MHVKYDCQGPITHPGCHRKIGICCLADMDMRVLTLRYPLFHFASEPECGYTSCRGTHSMFPVSIFV